MEKRGIVMSYFTQDNLSALEATATTAAAYLDACDSGARFVRLDPAYYCACGRLLVKILSLVDASKNFPTLLEQSAAVREVVDSIQIGRRIDLNSRVFYPELAVLLNRVAAT
jgi:hypothetical protein